MKNYSITVLLCLFDIKNSIYALERSQDTYTYCENYKHNYGYYCLARIHADEDTVLHLRAFCRAYRHHCPTTAEEMTRNPFHILADRETPDFPDVEKIERRLHHEQRREFQKALNETLQKIEDLKARSRYGNWNFGQRHMF